MPYYYHYYSRVLDIKAFRDKFGTQRFSYFIHGHARSFIDSFKLYFVTRPTVTPINIF